MYKEMPVIPVDRVVGKKRIIRKWRAEEKGRQKWLLTPPPLGIHGEGSTYCGLTIPNRLCL
jgi:hypothetical protein